jgi:hypothetical protein
VLGASCKTERVGVDRNFWLEPDADFCPIFSEDRYLNLKSYAKVGTEMDLHPPGSGSQSDRQSGLIADTFDDVRIDVSSCDGKPLQTSQEIVKAVLDNQTLVARTELENERYHALIEYPIKTINASERDWIFQTDTGPILFPDLSREPDSLLTSLELAYSAFNCFDWIEFIVRVSTPVSKTSMSITTLIRSAAMQRTRFSSWDDPVIFGQEGVTQRIKPSTGSPLKCSGYRILAV